VLIGRTEDFITQKWHSAVSNQYSAMLRFGERGEKISDTKALEHQNVQV
jgi:hypothetical protein